MTIYELKAAYVAPDYAVRQMEEACEDRMLASGMLRQAGEAIEEAIMAFEEKWRNR